MPNYTAFRLTLQVFSPAPIRQTACVFGFDSDILQVMKTHFVSSVLLNGRSPCTPLAAQLALLMLLGCYDPQRDLSVDPHNTPIIHILDAAYDAPTGMAVVRWEYLGQKPVANVILQRAEASAFRDVAQSSNASAQGEYATVGAFRDGDLIAGEAMRYRVVVEYSEGGSARTDAVDVAIPGASLRAIRRDPIALAVQVAWRAGGGTKYEITRTAAGGDAETVFTTRDSQQTSYWDESIADNRPYRYAIRSHLSPGVQLMSRSAQVQFYRNAGRHAIEPLRGGERIRLAATNSGGEVDMIALFGRVDQYNLSRLQHIFSPDRTDIEFWHLVGELYGSVHFGGGPVPQSLDLAGPPLGTPSASPRVYIGGIDPNGRVAVEGVNANTIVWRMPDQWISRSSHVRLAQDEQQRVYVATDGQLRVYSAEGNRLGAWDFAHGDPVDIAVHKNAIWAAWANRVRRGTARFSDEMFAGIAWENASLELQGDPIALTLNAAGQAFVLHRDGVQAFRADGAALISWALPPGAYAAGDVTIGGTARGLVHVSNEIGEVITYVP